MRTLTQIVEEMCELGMDRDAVETWLNEHARKRHLEDVEETTALISEVERAHESIPRDTVLRWLLLERIRHSYEAAAALARSNNTPLFMPDEQWAKAERD